MGDGVNRGVRAGVAALAMIVAGVVLLNLQGAH